MKAGPLVAVLLAYLVCSPPARAQRSAYIHGRVLDPSQAAVPEAAITVVDQESGFRRIAQTDSGGDYAVGSLDSGIYKVTVRKDGFRTMIRFNVKVANLEAAQVDFTLSVGAVQETITVEDTAPQPGQEDASIGVRVFREDIQRLPLNGRGVLGLLEHAHSAGLLQPQAVRVLLRAGAPGAPEPDRLLEPAGRAHGGPPNAAAAPTGGSPHHHLGQPAILSRRADRMGAPAARDRTLWRQREDPFRPPIVRASGHRQRGRSDGPARSGAGCDVPALLRTRHRPVPRAAAAATQRHLPAAPSLRRGLAEHPGPGGRADRLRAHRPGDRRVAGPLRRALPGARPIRTGRRAGAVPHRSGLARGSVVAVPLPHSGGSSQ